MLPEVSRLFFRLNSISPGEDDSPFKSSWRRTSFLALFLLVLLTWKLPSVLVDSILLEYGSALEKFLKVSKQISLFFLSWKKSNKNSNPYKPCHHYDLRKMTTVIIAFFSSYLFNYSISIIFFLIEKKNIRLKIKLTVTLCFFSEIIILHVQTKLSILISSCDNIYLLRFDKRVSFSLDVQSQVVSSWIISIWIAFNFSWSDSRFSKSTFFSSCKWSLFSRS